MQESHQDPLISIVVPCYNEEKFVTRCISSLLNQEYRDIEVLAMDDGSSDSTPSLLDSLAKNDSRLRVFHLPHGGMNAAVNAGLEKFTGSYVMSVNSDDYLAQGALSLISEVLTKNHPDIVHFYIQYEDNPKFDPLSRAAFPKSPLSTFNFSEKPYLLSKVSYEDPKDQGLLFAAFVNKAVRREIAKQHTLFSDCALVADSFLATQWLLESQITIILPCLLYIKSNSPTSQSVDPANHRAKLGKIVQILEFGVTYLEGRHIPLDQVWIPESAFFTFREKMLLDVSNHCFSRSDFEEGKRFFAPRLKAIFAQRPFRFLFNARFFLAHPMIFSKLHQRDNK
jgi:glycosyltransferase involved in cell wall biosynthesis